MEPLINLCWIAVHFISALISMKLCRSLLTSTFLYGHFRTVHTSAAGLELEHVSQLYPQNVYTEAHQSCFEQAVKVARASAKILQHSHIDPICS